MKFFIFCISLLFFQQSWALTAEQVQIKNDIISLALANTSEVDNRPEIRKQLDQMIAELTKDLPDVDTKTWALYSPGSWRQIWADEQNNMAGSPTQNLEKIFQFVSSQGRAVNFGERFLPSGDTVTFSLEAVGTVAGSVQTTEILKGFQLASPLPVGTPVKDLAADILDGTLALFSEVALGEFPKGPIGAKSDLTMLFLDDDLKIGTAPNVYTGFNEMFVLTRQELVQQ